MRGHPHKGARTPTTGTPYALNEYAIIPVGTAYRDGAWRELARDLSADLQSVFGVGVETVKWFIVRGHYDLDDLRLLDKTKYYFFNGQRVAMNKAGVVTYVLGDHLGFTAITADGSGAKVSELRYKPYGEVRYSGLPAGTGTDYRFTGQRQMSGLGLYQMGARWVDPALGRWLSADTLVPDPANPQSINRYSYTLGNPLKYVDPSGHWGRDIHFFSTRAWTYDLALQVVNHKGMYAPGYHANNLSLEIAWADMAVDVEAIVTYVLAGFDRKAGQAPDPALGGAMPEQYYHYSSKADAEARLNEAIEAKDPTAFGRALHSYQDYYSHTLTGFTAVEGDIESLFSNCPECFQSESYSTLVERARGVGHDGVSWPDEFDLADQRSIDMMNGTKWYTLLFLLNYYDMNLEQFLADINLSEEEWIERYQNG